MWSNKLVSLNVLQKWQRKIEFKNRVFAASMEMQETCFHRRETASSESTYHPVGAGKITSVKQDQRHIPFTCLNHILKWEKCLMGVLLNPSHLSIKLPFWFEIEIASYSICVLQTRQSPDILLLWCMHTFQFLSTLPNLYWLLAINSVPPIILAKNLQFPFQISFQPWQVNWPEIKRRFHCYLWVFFPQEVLSKLAFSIAIVYSLEGFSGVSY